MKKFLVVLFLAICSVMSAEPAPTPAPVAPVVAPEINWLTDIAAAKKKAQETNKDVLLVLAGTDWSEVSKLVDKNVLSAKEFYGLIDSKYVCVKVSFDRVAAFKDIPEDKAALIKQYCITKFPTLLFMDAKGQIYGQLTAEAQSFQKFSECEKYFSSMKTFRDTAFKQAELLQGAERANMYHNALTALSQANVFSEWSLYGYEDIIADIIKNDPTNKEDLKIGWEYRKFVFASRIAFIQKDYDGAMKAMEDFLAIYNTGSYNTDEDKEFIQSAFYAEAQMYAVKQDISGCIKVLEKLIPISPNSEVAKEATIALDELKRRLNAQPGPGPQIELGQ